MYIFTYKIKFIFLQNKYFLVRKYNIKLKNNEKGLCMKNILRKSLITVLVILFTASVIGVLAFAAEKATGSDYFTSVEDAKANGMVAKIGNATEGKKGEVFFDTLAKAVRAAKDGDTVYVISNINSHSQTTITNKTLKIVGIEKYTIRSADKKPFWLFGGGTFTLENLAFENCSNFISIGKDENSSLKNYTLYLKNVEVSFTASAAIYTYNADALSVTIDSCRFNAGAGGNALVNAGDYPGKSSFVNSFTFSVTDNSLNERCTILASNMTASIENGTTSYVMSESFSTDQKAKEGGVLLNSEGAPIRIGDTEGGKVGEVYFRSLDQYLAYSFNNIIADASSKLTINKDSAYSVVYYDQTHYATGTSTGIQAGHDYMGALKIANALFGSTVNLKKYSNANTVNKIYVGIVNKSFVSSKLEGIAQDEFAIIIENGNVYLLAWHDKALSVAIDTFVRLIDNGEVTLPVSGTYKFNVDLSDKWVLDFTRPAGLKLDSAQYVNDDSLQYLYYGTADDYNAYVNTLKGEGYTAVWENAIGKNKFVLLKNESKGNALYVAYNDFTFSNLITAKDSYRTSFEECIRIVASPLASITIPDDSVNKPNDYTKKIVGNSFVTSVGVASPGTSFIIALEDGRFIVIDGGFADESEALWNALNIAYKKAYGKTLANGDKIHIAAWYLTHAHADHWGAFSTMVSSYASKLKIDYVIANGIDRYSISLEEGQQTVFLSSENSNIAAMQEKVEGLKFIKVHAGQKLYFANMELEVLMTFEDHLPVPTTNSNDTNTIIRFNVRSGNSTTSMLFLGDSHRNASRYLVSMYGGYLKSDIVQLAHHGNVGVEAQIYELILAKMVFVPHRESCLSSSFQSSSTSYHILANKKAMELCSYLWFAPSGVHSTLEFTSNGPNYNSAVNYDGQKYIKKTSSAPAAKKKNPMEATCTKNGTKAYWMYMKLYYADEACTELIPDLTAWKAGEGKIPMHTQTKVTGKEATAAENGWKDYYLCSCGKYYADKSCKTQIEDLEAWKIGEGMIEYDASGERGCQNAVSLAPIALVSALSVCAVKIEKKSKKKRK